MHRITVLPRVSFLVVHFGRRSNSGHKWNFSQPGGGLDFARYRVLIVADVSYFGAVFGV